MKISAIIPHYNDNERLKKCVSNILGSVDEIMIVDDNSSVKPVFNNKKIKIIYNEKNKGAAYSRNIGIKKCRFGHILCLDSDMYIDEKNLKKLINSFKDKDILYPKQISYDSGSVMCPLFRKEEKYLQNSSIFFFNKNDLKILDELFDENYQIYHEDADFFFRCYLFGLRTRYMPKVIAYHDAYKKIKNLKNREYLKLRNSIYSYLKFLGISKKDKEEYAFPGYRCILGYLRNILKNKVDIDKKIYKLNKFYPMNFIIIFKAFFWNIRMLNQIIKKNKRLKCNIQKE